MTSSIVVHLAHPPSWGSKTPRVAGDDIAHRHLGIATGGDEFLTLVVGDVGTSASGVFLLPGPEKIGRVGDLGLDLLLAVAEVVVGDDRDDDTGLVAGAQLERFAVVVQLIGIVPAHSVTTLPVGGVGHVGQAEFLHRHTIQMGCEDDATGVSGPRGGVQGRVVDGQQWVSGVAEDRLDEIEVRDQATGDEESDLHAPFGDHAGHLGLGDDE